MSCLGTDYDGPAVAVYGKQHLTITSIPSKGIGKKGKGQVLDS